jgi:hypothetical protein
MSNPHLHSGNVKVGNVIGKPYHAQCSCGTAGDFPLEATAVGFLKAHFQKLGGIAETSLTIGEPKKPAPPISKKPAAVAAKPKVVSTAPPPAPVATAAPNFPSHITKGKE